MTASYAWQDLIAELRAAGAKPEHERRIVRALFGRAPMKAPNGANFPKAVLEAIPQIESRWAAVSRVVRVSGDKLLSQLSDGELVESVMLPREGLCISTQVGCAVGCRFCMTGRSGLVRQLTSAEMLAQVKAGIAIEPKLSKVKFMGMGEPAHNRRNLLETLDVLGGVLEFAHKNLTVSTVGDVKLLEALAAGPVRPGLAVSLHATDAELRRHLLPKAPDLAPETLVKMAIDYADLVKYPVQFEWTLLEGVNDAVDQIERLAGWLAGRRAMVNFIALNPIPDSPYRRVPQARAEDLITVLRRAGVVATLRQSAAQEVDGGCGQLRAKCLHEQGVAAKNEDQEEQGRIVPITPRK